jgi:hypothetical protein
MAIMYDQKTGKRVSVNDKYVDEYMSKGYGMTKPKSTTKNAVIYDSDSDLTKYYDSEGILSRVSRGNKSKIPEDMTNRGGGVLKQSSGGYSSGSLDDAYDEQRKALLNQLRASIAKAKGNYQDIINKAPQTYQPLRNQTELSKEQQLAAMREALANQGNRGGTGRQELLNINTAAGNAINDINLQQQNVINEANRGISDLEQQGKIQESQITADLAAQKLRDIIAQQQRADELAEEARRFNLEFGLKQSELDAKKQDELRQQFIDTIGRYGSNYQAQIDIVANDNDPSNDWQIPYLEAARQQKIDAANAKWQEQGYVSEDIAAALGKPVGTMTNAYKLQLQEAVKQQEVQNALKLFDDLGYVTPQMAAILSAYGLPSDARTLNALKTQYSINKPYPGGSGGSEKPWYLQ